MASEHAGPTGSAYDLPEPSYDENLAMVRKGTPAGELLRRYWHPIALAEEVKGLPVAVRALGEDLILFRTPNGKVGLVHPRCAHRGTTLLYGKVEERGIRCCYHGWLFDQEGRCLEQPCEPGGGAQRDLVRQPWYPAEERYGFVFAYLGPLAAKPVLPRYDILEGRGEGFKIIANGDSIGSGGPPRMPCNWFQTHENVMDPLHVFVLHSTFSSVQFNDMMAVPPEISFAPTEHGMYSVQLRKFDDGRVLRRITELVLPNIRIVADPFLRTFEKGNTVAWALPIDDTNTRIFTAIVVAKDAPPQSFNRNPMYGGKTWFELDAEGHQRFPGDFEAQVGQGPITWHSEEHLATSDRGVSMFRRMFRQSVRDVADGKDPINVVREGDALVRVRAGNYLLPNASAAE
ncbi:MAG TPA: aromatic ring-hydroxylating dioxygenase subunit alpha [Candidatus Cybelea sp.]|nr:aromatic ring-hydroxylating dioxygenase subunit alpha [Candidatus Cybelea sp.]